MKKKLIDALIEVRAQKATSLSLQQGITKDPKDWIELLDINRTILSLNNLKLLYDLRPVTSSRDVIIAHYVSFIGQIEEINIDVEETLGKENMDLSRMNFQDPGDYKKFLDKLLVSVNVALTKKFNNVLK